MFIFIKYLEIFCLFCDCYGRFFENMCMKTVYIYFIYINMVFSTLLSVSQTSKLSIMFDLEAIGIID